MDFLLTVGVLEEVWGPVPAEDRILRRPAVSALVLWSLFPFFQHPVSIGLSLFVPQLDPCLEVDIQQF